ncbi:MAG: succinate dehydrogenase cytochrome b subunit [Tannerellaceae bacterium]|jgi:succinate dehydrogenase / fumarate reductase cytochrome b subunit|nr:succinate dehydrogenase cytochrome b subunit [Tannerellaceae bacterium]
MWLLNSSIGRKLVMSLSGFFLILFLTFHATMNVVAVFSDEAYNLICSILGASWYAVAGTMILAAGFLVHIIYSIWITLQNRKARGVSRYAISDRPKSVEWASQNMFVLGLIVVCFIGLHLTQFWYKMMFAELTGNHSVTLGGDTLSVHDGAAFIRYYFSNIVVVCLYLVWYVALWFHLTHGFWSAIQTVGFSNGAWLKRWQVVSNLFATLVCGAFAFVTVFFYLKSIF